jgi:hypothetical protein
MRARKWILFVVLAVVAVIAARSLGLWAGSAFFPSVENAAPQPALVFADEDLTFGPIPESESVERELRLTNTSAEPVTVERFEKSCSCLGIEPTCHFTVPPGETAVLRVKLKAAIPFGAKLSSDGLFSEMMSVDAVVAGVKPTRFSATVRFTVQQTVRFDPPVVHLGVVSHREPVRVKATIGLRDPIREVRVLPHSEWDVTVTPTGKGQRELVATPARPGMPRFVNDPLQVVPVGGDGVERPARPLQVRGEVKSDVVSSPSVISLGRVKTGTDVVGSFRLASLTGRTFKVVKVHGETSDLRIEPDTVDPFTFSVHCRDRLFLPTCGKCVGNHACVTTEAGSPLRYHRRHLAHGDDRRAADRPIRLWQFVVLRVGHPTVLRRATHAGG